jgi:transposase
MIVFSMWRPRPGRYCRAGRDREVPHEPGCCGRCGAGLAGRPVTGVERRQVFDLPEVAVTVTEHQLIERECGCGHRTRAAAPRGGEAPVQYRPRVAAIIVYLYAGQFLSKERTAQALAELFGIALSSGTVAGITARAAGRLDGFLAQVRDTIAAAEVAGFDETGFRVDGRLHWVHLGSSPISLPDRHRAVEAALSRGAPDRHHRRAASPGQLLPRYQGPPGRRAPAQAGAPQNRSADGPALP